jgi:hypothetical protein
MMPDKPPIDSPEPPDPADLPPAAQWMMAQAAAAQAEPPQRAAADLAFTPLSQRRERVLGGLRGNDKLTAGLGTSAAAVLTEWGAAMGRHVVAETDGLDDAAAEELLQPRVRAIRQLMMSVARAAADPPPPGAAPLTDALRAADVTYGQRYAAPGRDAVGRALARWSAAAGRPAEQIAGLRAFIEGQLRPEAKGDANAAAA